MNALEGQTHLPVSPDESSAQGFTAAGGNGINLQGPLSSKRFNTLILRKNIIRKVQWDASTPGTIASGIDVSSVTDLDVENNLINNAVNTADAIKYTNHTNARIVNNRTTQGTELT